MVRHHFHLAIFMVCAAARLLAQATPASTTVLPTDPAQLFLLAQSENDIDVQGMKPWHLKATFQLIGGKDQPAETLTLDETWASPRQYRQTWAGPSLTQTVIVNHDGIFRTGGAGLVPSVAAIALKIIVHPLPEPDEAQGADLKIEEQTAGTTQYTCIISTMPHHAPSAPPGMQFDNVPRPNSYCFDHNSTRYRFTHVFTNFIFEANATGTFQDRTVATKVTVLHGDAVQSHGIVTDLRVISEPDAKEFVPGPEFAKLQSIHMADGVKAGRLIHAVKPIVPPSGGTYEDVIVTAKIGKDGHVLSAKVVGSPNIDMGMAARNAVMQWIYEPYTLNGQPVEVETTVAVHFAR